MITAQKILSLYFNHGALAPADGAAAPELSPFGVVPLEAVGTTGYGFATLGASVGPLQHELVIDTAAPLPAFADALEAIARAAPPLAPGVIVPHAIPGTRFTALLAMPLDDGDGSFSLTRSNPAPYALRLVPLTEAEQALAARESERVIELLRASFALTADPNRACLVDVPEAPASARTEIALTRRQTRAAVEALQAQMRREHGPRRPAPPQRAEKRRWRNNERIPPGAHIALLAMTEEMIRTALGPYVRHPAAVTYLFGELLYVTFATHPDAVRLLDRVLDARNLPVATVGDAGREAAAASGRVVEALALAIARLHPGERPEALLARGQAAIAEALATFDPADEIPVENHVWATTLAVLYDGVEDLKVPAVRGMPRVFRRVAQSEAVLELDPDPRPPLTRLREIAARMATELVTAYAAGLRGQLPA